MWKGVSFDPASGTDRVRELQSARDAGAERKQKMGRRAVGLSAPGRFDSKPGADGGRRSELREVHPDGSDECARERRPGETRSEQGADGRGRAGKIPAGAGATQHRVVTASRGERELSPA